MSKLDAQELNIILTAWNRYQDLIKGFGDSCWKIKSVAIGFWTTAIAYAYKADDIIISLFSILIIVLFFYLESGMKRLQYKYIEKSVEIENTINNYLADDESSFPQNGISTDIETPSFKDFIDLLKPKRWMFWMPYLILIIISILLSFLMIHL